MNDIIGYLLSNYSDASRFELLSSEIMQLEGYRDIKVIAGVNDQGVDGVVERYWEYKTEKQTIVFQFTLQDDIGGKIERTIKRLASAKIDYRQLVMVTRGKLSAEKQRTLKTNIRTEYDIGLELFEFSTIMIRLADLSNGIFHRYFPDPEKQIAILKTNKVKPADLIEEELLKVCLAFSFEPRATITRNSMLEEVVLAVLAIANESLTTDGIVGKAEECLKTKALSNKDQISACLKRLLDKKRVTFNVDKYDLSKDESIRLNYAGDLFKRERDSVVLDIVDDICKTYLRKVPEVERNQLINNAKEILVYYFRLNGIELASNFIAGEKQTLVYKTGLARLLELAQNRVEPKLGEYLLTAIGEALSNPEKEQADYFAGCSRSYIALQVMNIDPALSQFQLTRLKTKTFVLDTDIVLTCIVDELPLCITYRNIIKNMTDAGIRVVIPKDVMNEVVNHLNIAPRTYDYFHHQYGGISTLNEDLAKELIHNILVLGYWYKCKSSVWMRSGRDYFFQYRADYYEPAKAMEFIMDILRDALPKVEVGELEDLLKIKLDPAEVGRYQEAILKISEYKKNKGLRSEDQWKELARVDAKILSSIRLYKTSTGRTESKQILGEDIYVVTDSGVFISAISRAGGIETISTRPHILATLFGLIGQGQIDSREYVRLFENPILQKTVEGCFGEIKVLLAAGLEMRNKKLTRLRFDVEQKLHDYINNFRKSENEEVEEAVKDEKYYDLIKAARGLGYKTSDLLEDAIKEKELKDDEVEKLVKENEELRTALIGFGKRKERWLRRFDRLRKQG